MIVDFFLADTRQFLSSFYFLLLLKSVGTDAQSSNDTPIIIGVVCGCVALILLVVLVAIILVQRKKKKKENTGAGNDYYVSY